MEVESTQKNFSSQKKNLQMQGDYQNMSNSQMTMKKCDNGMCKVFLEEHSTPAITIEFVDMFSKFLLD